MGWEWVAPLSTGIGTVVSTLAVAYTASSGRKNAETIANQTSTSAKQLAHQEELTRRRADSYVDILVFMEKLTFWSESILPALDTDPPRPDPDFPDIAEQTRVSALVGAYASKNVRDAFEQHMKIVKEIRQAVMRVRMTIESNKGAPPGSKRDYMTSWGHLDDELRPAQKKAREALTQAISDELQYLPPDPEPKAIE